MPTIQSDEASGNIVQIKFGECVSSSFGLRKENALNLAVAPRSRLTGVVRLFGSGGGVG